MAILKFVQGRLAQGMVAGAALAGFSSISGPLANGGWYDGNCGGACGQSQHADVLQQMERGRMRNVRWPGQFICPDRIHAAAPFDIMVQNGWRKQNLLGAHHFSEDCTKLTQAGEIRVRWIMTQAPTSYRQIFIERSLDTELTKARIATTQEFASKVSLDGGVPTVTESHLVSDGRPAATVDYVNTQFKENMPVPALPAATAVGEEQ